ncbi:MAG TPA: hypothetical protein VMF89_37405 [Polyangiales bacterium]|nr:hypothetical protein [Polyangiales bacterium]
MLIVTSGVLGWLIAALSADGKPLGVVGAVATAPAAPAFCGDEDGALGLLQAETTANPSQQGDHA